MSLKVEFKRILRRLGEKEIAPFMKIIEDPTGKQTISRRFRDRKIAELQSLAEKMKLPKLVRQTVKKCEIGTVYFRKGLRVKDRTEILKKRFGERHKHLVYIMWNRRGDCLKVGRSDKGIGRVIRQKDTYYFLSARCIRIFYPKRRRMSSIPALECILTHHFQPRIYRVTPAKKKYAKKCPICRMNTSIRREIRKRFAVN